MASINGAKKGDMVRISLYTPVKVIKMKGSGTDLHWRKSSMGVREAETFFNAQRIINKALETEPDASFKVTCDVDGVHYVGDFDFGKAKILKLASAKQMLAIMRVELT